MKKLVQVSTFRRSVRIHFPLVGGGPPSGEPRGACSQEQSLKSRLRAAWALANAETEWHAMVTCTYGHDPGKDEARRDCVRFRRRLLRLGFVDWAWIREFTEAGRVHYHWFLGGESGVRLRSEATRIVSRHGNPTELCEGPTGQAVAQAWGEIAAERAEDEGAVWRFTWGGIVELLRHPDAAGRYAAKEAAKRVQKRAPWPNPGRWWAMSPHLTPQAREVTMQEWPQGLEARTVFSLTEWAEAIAHSSKGGPRPLGSRANCQGGAGRSHRPHPAAGPVAGSNQGEAPRLLEGAGNTHPVGGASLPSGAIPSAPA